MAMDTTLYSYLVIPVLVFLARVVDVTLGTMRIIFISRGKRHIAPVLGFVEVFIWIAVVAQIVSGANNLVAYLAYAAGFATGNYVGMYIEERLALGTLILRIILPKNGLDLVTLLHKAGFGVTSVDGLGANGPVKLIYTVVKRRDLALVLEIIHQVAPKVFLSIEEVRSTEEGIFPPPHLTPHLTQPGVLIGRKSK
jgi:uncharacterized protein YebE (UPF0316 family)